LNKILLHTEVQQFIHDHLQKDLPSLILKGSPFKDISIQELAEQILSKSKCQIKLPTWFQTKGIYYPKPVSIEQTSSEITAGYKSTLIGGNTLIDLTGGFGVDSYYFSKKINKVIHCEIDKDLSEIAKYNFRVLEAYNTECREEDGIELLNNEKIHYDWIYIDPSRRSASRAKVFKLEDCLPDVSLHLDLFLQRSTSIMIKLSPFLDISSTVNSLKFVKEIHIVAVKNEVKELILLIEKDYLGPTILKAVHIVKKMPQIFEGSFPSRAEATYSLAKKYLYEPNSAILKSGLFNEVSSQLEVCKLHVNSHLYTSDEIKWFPGRRFEIQSVIKYNKKLIKKTFGFKKANITVRNFYESVAQIRKKTGLKEGGDDYLFFTTDLQDKAIVIHCKKV